MRYMGEELDAEVVHLFFHLHLLVQIEVATPRTIEKEADSTDEHKIDNPGKPRIIPWLPNDDAELSFFTPMVA